MDELDGDDKTNSNT